MTNNLELPDSVESYAGYSPKKSRIRLLEIWAKEFPAIDFEGLHPKIFTWCEVWHQLRSKNATIDALAKSFQISFDNKNALIHRLSETIYQQRLRIRQLEEAQAGAEPAATGASDSEKTK